MEGEGRTFQTQLEGLIQLLAQNLYADPAVFLREMIVNAHQLLAADVVTTDAGTVLVNLAPAFGEEDKAVTDVAGIAAVVPAASAGQFTSEVPPYAGMQVLDANRAIIRDFRDGATHVGGVLLRHETYEHLYPHCWRCNNPLIPRAVSSWFVEAYPRVDVYGSLGELECDFGVRPVDLHRPFVDQLTRPGRPDRAFHVGDGVAVRAAVVSA